jgi:hypothetical protein
MKQIIIAAGIWAGLFFAPTPAEAQNKYPRGWEFKINGGYNLGGTSPLPLPEEIRKIEGYSLLLFAPHVALEAIRPLNEKWGVSLQLTLDHKGFTVRDRVKSLHTEIKINDETYAGNFTGSNLTKIHNVYITLPVSATYRISDLWLVQAGWYVAYLNNADFKGAASDGYIRRGDPTGEKTMVDNALFDFSDKQNKFDYGIQVAAERSFYARFAVRGQIAWGLNSLFPAQFTGMSFPMYNIYGTIGVSYQIH